VTTIDPPLTWHIDLPLLEQIAHQNHDMGSNGWRDAMRDEFPADWQEEIERRSGEEFSDVIWNGVRALMATEPALLAEELRRTFAQYGITLTVGELPPVDPQDVPSADWLYLTVTDGAVARVWNICEQGEPDPEAVADALYECFMVELDYFDLLPGGYDGILEDACAAYPAGGDPSLFFLALRRAFAERDVPVTFMAHPEHGDVIARAEALGPDAA
jgi:hypothetical protein